MAKEIEWNLEKLSKFHESTDLFIDFKEAGFTTLGEETFSDKFKKFLPYIILVLLIVVFYFLF